MKSIGSTSTKYAPMQEITLLKAAKLRDVKLHSVTVQLEEDDWEDMQMEGEVFLQFGQEGGAGKSLQLVEKEKARKSGTAFGLKVGSISD